MLWRNLVAINRNCEIRVLLTIHIRWSKLKYGVMTEHGNG